MVAWVSGAAIGLIPFGGHAGLLAAAGFVVLGSVRAVLAAVRLRKERLRGAPAAETSANARVAEARVAEATTVAAPRTPPAAARPDTESTTQSLPRRGRFGRRQQGPRPAPAATKVMPADATLVSPVPDDQLTPPGYTLYRPSRPDPTARLDGEEPGR
jgi:hypothetical protein